MAAAHPAPTTAPPPTQRHMPHVRTARIGWREMSNPPVIKGCSGADDYMQARKNPMPDFQGLKYGPSPESPHGRLSLVTADRREGPCNPPVCPNSHLVSAIAGLYSFVPFVSPGRLCWAATHLSRFLPTSLFRTRSTLSLWCRARLALAIHASSFPASPLIPDNLARDLSTPDRLARRVLAESSNSVTVGSVLTHRVALGGLD
ncbi:hypothetical protein B0T14DRAFT_79776 [Immersiella caudata]|uniref:Uncharacterized protein n=1 Tax=Immersiella caudata TaxID=314043 RepID=A0AA40CDT3_9PEZI|nr:hypothetical protein B0T14DRAFT_79776 [Immersiella caudata]